MADNAPAINPRNNVIHAPIGQVWNDGSSTNSWKFLLLTDNDCAEGTQYQDVTSTNGYDLVMNTNKGNSRSNKKLPQKFNPDVGISTS